MQKSSHYPHEQPQSKNWWEQNWKWFIPTLLLGGGLSLVGFIYSIFLLVTTTIKSSEVYQGALHRAQKNIVIQEQLGTPIKDGLMPSGEINTTGASGKAILSIPISGPKDSATIYINADKNMGTWKFNTLEVKIHKTGSRIEL